VLSRAPSAEHFAFWAVAPVLVLPAAARLDAHDRSVAVAEECALVAAYSDCRGWAED
jgi:hypothetical protein